MNEKNNDHSVQSNEPMKLLLVSVAHHEFAIPIQRHLDTSSCKALLKAPELPPVFSGFIRFEKQLVPIVKLDALFQVKQQNFYAYSKAVVLEAATVQGRSKTFGLLVDEVLGEYETDRSELHKLLGHYLLNCIDHQIEISDQMYPVICPRSLLDDIEDYCLQQFSVPVEKASAKMLPKI